MTIKQNFSDRPRIRPELTPVDWLIELITLFTLGFLWGYVLYHFSGLPETIPQHYSLTGEVDKYGSRNFIWFFPVLSTFLVIGLTVLNRFPFIFNFPVAITSQNALRQYSLATRLIRILKMIIIIMFAFISLNIVQTSIHPGSGSLMWLILIFILIILGTLMVYFFMAMKK